MKLEVAKLKHEKDLSQEIEKNSLLQQKLHEISGTNAHKIDGVQTSNLASHLASETEARNNVEQKTRLEQAKQKLTSLDKDLNSERRKCSKLEERIGQLEKGLTSQGRDINTYKFQIAGLEHTVKSLTTQLRAMTAQRNDAMSKLRST